MPPFSRRSCVNLALGLSLPLLIQIETARATRNDGFEQHASATIAPSLEDGARAFDFLIGEWTVAHRRRTQILKGAETWSEFGGALQARAIWDGRGHIDEFRGDSPGGVVEGMSLRLYDPGSNQWRDYYTNASRRTLDPPILGSVRNGRLEFFGHELFEGKNIYVRQIWSVRSPTACRWEQAFSADGGVTWETNWVMDLTRKAPASSSQAPAGDAFQSVVELRQYTLRPGQRDVLIDLFEREFIEGQEATGMAIMGQFRDLDRPDRFVWIRGFPDMPTRASSLQAFYDGPVWQRHRTIANGTMVDSDNVLLLRPAHSGTGFARPKQPRSPRGATATPPTVVLGVICSFKTAVDLKFVDFFEQRVRPVLEQEGGRTLGSFVTEASPNNFPRLPVREGEHVFVWFSAFASGQALERLVGSSAWTALEREMTPRLSRAPERLRLAPTARSLLGRGR